MDVIQRKQHFQGSFLTFQTCFFFMKKLETKPLANLYETWGSSIRFLVSTRGGGEQLPAPERFLNCSLASAPEHLWNWKTKLVEKENVTEVPRKNNQRKERLGCYKESRGWRTVHGKKNLKKEHKTMVYGKKQKQIDKSRGCRRRAAWRQQQQQQHNSMPTEPSDF